MKMHPEHRSCDHRSFDDKLLDHELADHERSQIAGNLEHQRTGFCGRDDAADNRKVQRLYEVTVAIVEYRAARRAARSQHLRLLAAVQRRVGAVDRRAEADSLACCRGRSEPQ